jgi:hypothetical protein
MPFQTNIQQTERAMPISSVDHGLRGPAALMVSAATTVAILAHRVVVLLSPIPPVFRPRQEVGQVSCAMTPY